MLIICYPTHTQCKVDGLGKWAVSHMLADDVSASAFVNHACDIWSYTSQIWNYLEFLSNSKGLL